MSLHFQRWPVVLVVALAIGCQKQKVADVPSLPAKSDGGNAGTVIDSPQRVSNFLDVQQVINKWGEEPDIAWDTVIKLGELCKLSYEDQAAQQKALNELGLTDVVMLKTATKGGFVAEGHGTVVIAFRGTARKIDWIANLDFRQLPDANSGRGFHSGFQGAYNSFDKIIRDFVRRKNPERVWITGHSLGGGMAACCAYALLKEKLPISGVVTFGQPRVGNEAVAQYLDAQLGDRYLRVMNEGDPVPILPPSIGRLMPAYWHTGRRVWFFGGQLLTTEGPTVYSQTGPGDEDDNDNEENYLDETTGDDLTASITEEDFLELQREMKAVPADELLPPKDTAVYGAAAPRASRAIFDGVLGFFRDRIGEHYMDSYLTQLRGHVERQK